jgi:hypothetical protein
LWEELAANVPSEDYDPREVLGGKKTCTFQEKKKKTYFIILFLLLFWLMAMTFSR